jgi:hypothetical protein
VEHNIQALSDAIEALGSEEYEREGVPLRESEETVAARTAEIGQLYSTLISTAKAVYGELRVRLRRPSIDVVMPRLRAFTFTFNLLFIHHQQQQQP